MRHKDGNDQKVEEFMMSHPETEELLERLKSFVTYLIPQYASEGKSYLTVAIGCTGGRHRSVMIANVLARHLRGKRHPVKLNHRDVEKE